MWSHLVRSLASEIIVTRVVLPTRSDPPQSWGAVMVVTRTSLECSDQCKWDHLGPVGPLVPGGARCGLMAGFVILAQPSVAHHVQAVSC